MGVFLQWNLDLLHSMHNWICGHSGIKTHTTRIDWNVSRSRSETLWDLTVCANQQLVSEKWGGTNRYPSIRSNYTLCWVEGHWVYVIKFLIHEQTGLLCLTFWPRRRDFVSCAAGGSAGSALCSPSWLCAEDSTVDDGCKLKKCLDRI